MIIQLDLAKTYGQQNEDIAKKNKITQIDISINSINATENPTDENSIGYTIPLDNIENNKFAQPSSETNNNIDVNMSAFGSVTGTSPDFNSYYGVIMYKNYNITLNLNDEQYSQLKYANTIIPYITKFSGLRKYANSESNHVLFTKYGTPVPLGSNVPTVSSIEIEEELSKIDLPTMFSNIGTGNFWGISQWNEETNINDNNYHPVNDDGSIDMDTNIDAYSEIINFVQTGANDTKNKFLNLNSYIQPIITNWNNTGDNLYITIQIPYQICFLRTTRCQLQLDGNWGTQTQTIDVITNFNSYSIYQYIFDELSLQLVFQYDITNLQKIYYDGNRKYSTENSFLFNDKVHFADMDYSTITHPDGTSEIVYDKYYPENFADEIYETYQNGKIQLEIKYPVGKLQTTLGLDIYYNQDYGIVLKIGNEYFNENGDKIQISSESLITDYVQITEGTICNIVKNGEQIYKNSDGSIKYFLVQTSNLIYSGILINELTLIESAENYVSNFDELSWAEIDALGRNNELNKYLSIGEKKYVNIAGNAVNPVPLVILGFNHDDLANGNGKAGMTIGMESVLTTEYPMNNTASTSIGWHNSDFRTNTIPSLVSALPTDLQSILKPVIKKSNNDALSLTNITTTEDTLFLLSLSEITGDDYISQDSYLSTYYPKGEGEQYEYWKTVKDGTIAIDREKLDYNTANEVNGEMQYVPVSWGTRSISGSPLSGFFATISNDGSIIGGRVITNNTGISYAFCVGEVPFNFEGTLEDATWQEINYISTNGLAQQYFNIGDEKTITLSTGQDVTFVILGFNHDDLSDDSGKAGITFGMKNLLYSYYTMNSSATNSGGWGNSSMRNSTMQTLLSQLPEDLQSVIKSVTKSYCEGQGLSAVSSSTDKLWLLSIFEIYNSSDMPSEYLQEGSQYEYWTNKIGGASPYDATDGVIKYMNNGQGNSAYWWTRSASNTNNGFGIINYNGFGGISMAANNDSVGVSFCFCI